VGLVYGLRRGPVADGCEELVLPSARLARDVDHLHPGAGGDGVARPCPAERTGLLALDGGAVTVLVRASSRLMFHRHHYAALGVRLWGVWVRLYDMGSERAEGRSRPDQDAELGPQLCLRFHGASRTAFSAASV
jgi:hypothetical protein